MWRRAAAGAERLSCKVANRFVPGTEVSVELPERFVLVSALVMHGIPWAALLAGAAAGTWLTGTDAGAAAGAVAGIVAGVAATPGVRRRLERRAERELVLSAVE